MSDVTVTFHNLASLVEGKSTFSEFETSEGALFKQNVASLPVLYQASAGLMLSALMSGASSLVAAGNTAIGPIINESSDAQSTMILNGLQAMGVPTGGAILTVAEHAALVMFLNGLKAGIDHIGLQITTAGISEKPVAEIAPAKAA